MKCFLEVLIGANQGQIILITAQPFVVGRSEESSLRCTNQSVSRRHCEFIQKNDRMHLVDLGSRNGTFLNDRLLPAAEATALKSGDIVKIAGHAFAFYVEGDERIDDAQELLMDGSVDDLTDDKEKSCIQIIEDDNNENLLAVQNERGMDMTWDQNVSAILKMIGKSHIYYPGTDADDALLDSGTSTGDALRGLFDFVGVFDCRKGRVGSMPFELGAFLQFHVRDLLSSLLGLTLGPEYNQEQIPQMLEDFGEKKCLWCFLHSELLSANDLQHLREFTQSRHRVLFCGPNPTLAQKCEKRRNS